MKKTVFYITLVLISFMFLVETAAVGILPYMIASFLMYQSIYQKKDRTTSLGVVAAIMCFLNFFLMLEDVYVLADVIAWAAIFGAFGVPKK